MKRWVVLMVVGAPALLPGCYGSKVLRQPVTVEESARDLEAMRQQQAGLETRMAALEKSSAEQGELLRSFKADTYARFTDLDARLGAIDAKLRDALGTREGYARNPSIWSAAPSTPQSRAAETAATSAGEGSTGAAEGTDATSPETARAARDTTAAPAASSETDAKRIYDQAYKDLTRGNYSLAILGFREFLQRAGSSDLADNAQYWIGESYYAQRDFSAAIQEFLKVPERWEKGDKVPAALLKSGYSYLQLDDRASARKYLNQVIEQFPNSEEAVNAKNKLRSAM